MSANLTILSVFGNGGLEITRQTGLTPENIKTALGDLVSGSMSELVGKV